MLELVSKGNLGIEIIRWGFPSFNLFFMTKRCLYREQRAGHVSSLGILSADLQGHAWLPTLLLRPLEGLLWPPVPAELAHGYHHSCVVQRR